MCSAWWHGSCKTFADVCLPRNSRQAIKKYVQANNNLSGVTDAAFNTQLNRALQKGSETGVFARPKGTSPRTFNVTINRTHDRDYAVVQSSTALRSTSLFSSRLKTVSR